MVACALIDVGVPLILALGLGFVPIMVGGAMLALIGVWVAVRSVLGIVYALKGEPYPRPRNLII